MRWYKMMKKNVYILYTVLFVAIWSIITLPFLLRGNSLIGAADSFNQSFPVFVYIGNYIHELLKGNFMQFDFRLGLGDDVLETLNVHGFGDITQILSAFISPEKAETAYEFIVASKFYLSGIAFLIYSKTYLQNICYRAAGALVYALSVFTMFWGLNCWMFLNPIITLPLILYGIDQILLKPRKLSCIMVLSLFYQALNGFYYLYMEILIAVIYFLIVSFSRTQICKDTLKSIASNAVAVAIQGMLGVLMGSVLLIPSIIGFLSSTRTDGAKGFPSIIQLFFFNNPEYYVHSFANLLVPDAYTSIITIPIILLLGGTILITKKSKRKDLRILAIFFCVAFWIPFTGYLMNGLSYWADRWYFAVLLFLTLGVFQVAEERNLAGKSEIIIFEIITFLSIFLHALRGEKTLGLAIQIVLFSLQALLMPYIWNYVEKREKIILGCVVLLVTMNGLLVFGPKALGGSGYSAAFKAKGSSYGEICESMEKVETQDTEFQRLDIYASSLGSSLVMDYYGTTEYFSILNSYVSEFYREMAISPGVRSATWILKGLDGRYELEALLSASQYMDFETDTAGEPHAFVRKTSDMLPLGFTYTKYISREEFDKLDTMGKHSAIVNGLVIENFHEETAELEEIPISRFENNKIDREIPISLEEQGIEHIGQSFKAKEDARIRVYLENVDEDEDAEYYVKLSDFLLLDEGRQDIYVGNKNIQLRNREDDYYMGVDEFWVNVTELKKENDICYFDILLGGGYKSFALGELQVFSHIPDKKAITERKSNVLENLKIETNKVSGTITTDEVEALFLSIPYSKGWKAYIDGVETDIERANIAFMGFILEPGEHDIVLIYTTPGIKIGLLLSLMSILIVIGWKVREKVMDIT